MKKVILTLLTFLSLQVSAALVEKEIDIDFRDFPNLQMEPVLDFKQLSNNGQTNCTNYKILSSPLTISFDTGMGTLGAAIFHVDDFYSLILRAFCEMRFEVSGGCQLTSIQFYNQSSIASASVGRYDTNALRWEPNGATNVTSVALTNGFSDAQISKVKVKYSIPPTPLILTSSTPAAGNNVTSFSNMLLTFNTEVNKVNSGNVTLTSTNGTNEKMIATASGTNVKLSLSKEIEQPGTYTVHIPEGLFETAEESTNDRIDITFNLIARKDTFNPISIDPDSGSVVTVLPKVFKLEFKNYVHLSDGIIKFVHNGTPKFPAKCTIDEESKTVVYITYDDVPDIKEPGVWEVQIPEGIFQDPFIGTDFAAWNSALSLKYTVTVPQDSETMKRAKDMLKKTGVGFPMDTTATWKALNELVHADPVASDEALNVAINNLFDEKAVELPEVDSWYKIIGFNASNKKLYLTLDDEKTKVLLGNNESKAAAFKVKSVDNQKIVFQTKEGLFLHVPHTLPNYIGTSKKNLTTEESSVNQLTFAKFSLADLAPDDLAKVDSTLLYGAFSIYGSLGTKNDAEAFAFATIGFSETEADFITDPSESLKYNETASSAFVLSKTTEPKEVVEKITPTFSLSPSNKIKQVGDELYFCITGPEATEIADQNKIYFVKNEKKLILSHQILSPTAVSNKFSVNTEGLNAGTTYQLVAEKDAFTFTNPAGVEYVTPSDVEIELTIGEDTRLVPEASADTIVYVGQNLVLTIKNIPEVSLSTTASPSLLYAEGDKKGQVVPFTKSILTPVSVSKTQFDVHTAELEAGKYTLLLPEGTFVYKTEDGKEVKDVEMSVTFRVKTKTVPTGFNETYTNIIYVTSKYRMQKGIDVIADVDLNDFIICVYDFMGYTALYGNPKGVVTVKAGFGGEILVGHFETYSSEELVEKYGDMYSDAWALKFVPDTPLQAGDLDFKDGMYGYYFYSGAFGDDNYRKYLSGDTSIEKADCLVNPAMAGPTFYVNNKEATGIKTISSSGANEKVIYDLQGRRLTDTSKKGIYIINGRKVIVK